MAVRAMSTGKTVAMLLLGCTVLVAGAAVAHQSGGGQGGGSHSSGGAHSSGGSAHSSGGSAHSSGGSAHASGGYHGGGGSWHGGGGSSHGGAPAMHFAPRVAPHVTSHFAQQYSPHYSTHFAPHVAPAPRGWGRYRGGRFYGPWGAWWWWGGYVSVLPWYYDTFWWGGVPYYYADYNYYLWDSTARQYAIVAPPRADDPGSGPVDGDFSGAAAEPMVYPSAGQTPDQLARDRYECHRWAADQTGFDPTRSDGGVPVEDVASGNGKYRRAEVACLSGRGYTVR
jgi:hypothetical protein